MSKLEILLDPETPITSDIKPIQPTAPTAGGLEILLGESLPPEIPDVEPPAPKPSIKDKVRAKVEADMAVPYDPEAVLRRSVVVAPEMAMDLAKAMVIDFPAYYGAKWLRAGKGAFFGEKGEESVVTDWKEDISTKDQAIEFAEKFVQQVDRGYRTIKHPIHSIRHGEPPEMSPEVEQVMEVLGVVFEKPREHVFQPFGDWIGKLFDNELLGEMSADALEVTAWVVAPYKAVQAGRAGVGKYHKAQMNKVIQQLEAQHVKDLQAQRTSLLDVLDSRKRQVNMEEIRVEAARKAEAQRAEWEARQKMYEDLFNEPNVKQFLDDMEAFLQRKKNKKEGPVTRSEAELLYQRWVERISERDLQFDKDYRAWRREKLKLESEGIQPAWELTDRLQVEIGQPGRGLPPGKTDLKFGVEAGRPYPQIVAPETGTKILTSQEKVFRLKRDVLGHKADHTLQQKMRVPKKGERAEIARETADVNKAGEQLNNLSRMGDELAVELTQTDPKPAPKVRSETTVAEPTPRDTAIEALRVKERVDKTGEGPRGERVKGKPIDPTVKPKPDPTAAKTEVSPPKGRAKLIEDAAMKMEEQRQARQKPLTEEARREMQVRAELDSYHGIADNLEQPRNPMRDSIFDDTIRPISEIWEDFKTLNKDNPERGSFSNKPLGPEQAAAADRLMKDVVNIARKAVQDGKSIAQWLLDNQYVVDPRVAEAVQRHAEGAISHDRHIVRSETASPVQRGSNVQSVSEWLRKSAEAETNIQKKVKGLYGRVAQEVWALDPDVRVSLIDDMNPMAHKVLLRKINAKGAYPQAKMYWEGVYKNIFAKMSKKERAAFNQLIAVRSQADIFRRHPNRKLPEGVTDRAAFADWLHQKPWAKGLDSAQIKKLEFAANEYFDVMRDLLKMKHEAGAISDWLYDLIVQNEYSPTIWQEIIDRVDYRHQQGKSLSFEKPPKTFEEFQKVTDGRHGLPKDLQRDASGIKQLTGGRKGTIKMDAQELMASLIAHTHAWVYGNTATQWLGKYADMGTNPSVMPAEIKTTQLTPKGGRLSTSKQPDGSRRVTLDANKEGFGILKYDSPSKQWVASVTDRAGKTEVLGRYDKARKARGEIRQKLAEEVYGPADATVEAPVYERPPSGMKEIHYFDQGIQKTLWAEDWFAAQWTNSMVEIRSDMMNFLRKVSLSGVVREFATGAGNPFFFTRSLPMDWMHLHVADMTRMPDGKFRSAYSPHLPIYSAQLLKDMGTVFGDVIHRKGRFLDYFKEGGGVDFLTAMDLYPKVRGKVGHTVDWWREWFGFLNRQTEVIVRLAHRERLIKQGFEPWEATAIARDRLDYSQGGRSVKIMDSVIPYANAAAQATRGVFRAWKHDPATAAYKSAWLAGTSALLYAYKSKYYPEILENESAFEQVGYWTIPTGLYTTNEYGEKLHYSVKLRKDPSQTAITAMADLMMAAAMGDEVRFNRIWLSMADMAPVFQGFPLPPVFKAAVAYGTNTDPTTLRKIYNGPDVDPGSEWSHKHTSAFYRDIVGQLGVSPDRYKNMLEQIITRNNIWAEAATGAYDFLFDNVEQHELNAFLEQYLLDNIARKSLFSVTAEGVSRERVDKMLERDREVSGDKSMENSYMDRLLEGHYLHGTLEFDAISSYITEMAEQRGKRTAERLIDRHELFVYLSHLPSKDRRFWLRMQAFDNSGERGRAVAEEWLRRDDEERQMMAQAIGILQKSPSTVVPKDLKSEFWEEYGKALAQQYYE